MIHPPLDDVCALPSAPRNRLVLAVPRRDVLVVAGLPGAGKTTLIRLVASEGDIVLDPQHLADPIRAALPAVPYGLYRPVVHAVHRARVMIALFRGRQSLIIHEPGGRPRWRRMLVAAARRRGLAVHLLVIQADPAEAHRARSARRRTLPTRWAVRYEREWATLCDEVLDGWPDSRLAAEGFTGLTLLPRSAITALLGVRDEA